MGKENNGYMVRPIVCGGRDFTNRTYIFKTLDYHHAEYGPFEVVIHGAARGADSIAGEWARARGIPELAFPANWDKHGRSAGPIRNQQMIDEGKPDGLIAFPGGKGTEHMLKISRGKFTVFKSKHSVPFAEQP